MKTLDPELQRVLLAALDSMPHGLAVYDTQGEILLSNKCFKTYLNRYSKTQNLLADEALPPNFHSDMEKKGSCDFLAYYDKDMNAHPSYAGGPVNRVHTAKVMLDGKHYGYTIAATDATEDEHKSHLLNCYARDSKLVLDNIQVGLVCLKSDYTVLWKGIDSIYGKELASKMYNVGTHCYEHFGATEPCKDCPVTWAIRDQEAKYRVFHDPSNDSYLDVNVTPVYKQKSLSDTTYFVRNKNNATLSANDADTSGTLSQKGEIVAYMMELRNVTRREKAMRELEEARNKAQEGERAKTAFLRNMSHEFRTPLNALLGFTEALCSPDFDKLSIQERQEIRSLIRSNSRQMLNMFNDIIDFTNIEAQTLLPKNDKVNIEELFEHSVMQMHELLQPGVDIKLDIQQTGEPIILHTDQADFTRVLNHLLSNACKNTYEGSITLSARRISSNELKQTQPDIDIPTDTTQWIEIAVTDTGAGISATDSEVIFRPFYKGDHFKPGTGMGLPISILTAKALGGLLYLDKNYSNGARFVVLHPGNESAIDADAGSNVSHTLADVK